MYSKVNKILASVFAIGLGVGEAVMNWGNWQYAPLWIVDYMIVIALLIGVFQVSIRKSASSLKASWAFSFGVMYMALFVTIDPDKEKYYNASPTTLYLIGLLITLSVIGIVLSVLTEKSLTRRSSWPPKAALCLLLGQLSLIVRCQSIINQLLSIFHICSYQ